MLILSNNDIGKQYQQNIEGFIGLNVGHSVRTLQEFTVIATHDITVFTSIMESRTLQGPAYQFESLVVNIAPEKM